VNSLERLRENVKYSVYHICFFSTDQAEIWGMSITSDITAWQKLA
jgi:hypothetical protein